MLTASPTLIENKEGHAEPAAAAATNEDSAGQECGGGGGTTAPMSAQEFEITRSLLADQNKLHSAAAPPGRSRRSRTLTKEFESSRDALSKLMAIDGTPRTRMALVQDVVPTAGVSVTTMTATSATPEPKLLVEELATAERMSAGPVVAPSEEKEEAEAKYHSNPLLQMKAAEAKAMRAAEQAADAITKAAEEAAITKATAVQEVAKVKAAAKEAAAARDAVRTKAAAKAAADAKQATARKAAEKVAADAKADAEKEAKKSKLADKTAAQTKEAEEEEVARVRLAEDEKAVAAASASLASMTATSVAEAWLAGVSDCVATEEERAKVAAETAVVDAKEAEEKQAAEKRAAEAEASTRYRERLLAAAAAAEKLGAQKAAAAKAKKQLMHQKNKDFAAAKVKREKVAAAEAAATAAAVAATAAVAAAAAVEEEKAAAAAAVAAAAAAEEEEAERVAGEEAAAAEAVMVLRVAEEERAKLIDEEAAVKRAAEERRVVEVENEEKRRLAAAAAAEPEKVVAELEQATVVEATGKVETQTVAAAKVAAERLKAAAEQAAADAETARISAADNTRLAAERAAAAEVELERVLTEEAAAEAEEEARLAEDNSRARPAATAAKAEAERMAATEHSTMTPVVPNPVVAVLAGSALVCPPAPGLRAPPPLRVPPALPKARLDSRPADAVEATVQIVDEHEEEQVDQAGLQLKTPQAEHPIVAWGTGAEDSATEEDEQSGQGLDATETLDGDPVPPITKWLPPPLPPAMPPPLACPALAGEDPSPPPSSERLVPARPLTEAAQEYDAYVEKAAQEIQRTRAAKAMLERNRAERESVESECTAEQRRLEALQTGEPDAGTSQHGRRMEGTDDAAEVLEIVTPLKMGVGVASLPSHRDPPQLPSPPTQPRQQAQKTTTNNNNNTNANAITNKWPGSRLGRRQAGHGRSRAVGPDELRWFADYSSWGETTDDITAVSDSENSSSRENTAKVSADAKAKTRRGADSTSTRRGHTRKSQRAKEEDPVESEPQRESTRSRRGRRQRSSRMMESKPSRRQRTSADRHLKEVGRESAVRAAELGALSNKELRAQAKAAGASAEQLEVPTNHSLTCCLCLGFRRQISHSFLSAPGGG